MAIGVPISVTEGTIEVPDVGSLVSFRIRDVYLPEGKELLEQLTESNIVVGRLIACCAWFRSRPVVQGVIPDERVADRTPVLSAWLCAGVVGACGWYANDGCRSAEHVVPADRCAHEIIGFLKVAGGAQRRLNSTVGPHYAYHFGNVDSF